MAILGIPGFVACQQKGKINGGKTVAGESTLAQVKLLVRIYICNGIIRKILLLKPHWAMAGKKIGKAMPLWRQCRNTASMLVRLVAQRVGVHVGVRKRRGATVKAVVGDGEVLGRGLGQKIPVV